MGNSAQRTEGGFITVTLASGVTANAFTRLKFTSTGWAVCGLTDVGQAVLDEDITTAAGTGRARLLTAQGTQFGIASGAVAAGDTQYTAASGQLSSTQGTNAVAVAIALTAAADQGIFTYVRI